MIRSAPLWLLLSAIAAACGSDGDQSTANEAGGSAGTASNPDASGGTPIGGETGDGGEPSHGTGGTSNSTGGSVSTGGTTGGGSSGTTGGSASGQGGDVSGGAGGEAGATSSCSRKDDELSGVLAAEPSELMQQIATALAAALSPSDLEQIAQIDWDTVPAEVLIGDPALRKALEITANHIDACDQGKPPPVLPATEQECIEAMAKLVARLRAVAKVVIESGATQGVLALVCTQATFGLCAAGTLYNVLNGGLGISGTGVGSGLRAVLELCSCDEVVCPAASVYCSDHDLAYTRSTCTFGICGTSTSLTDCAPYADVGEGTCKEIGEDEAECVDACAGVTCNQLPDSKCDYGSMGNNSAISSYTEYCYGYGQCYFSTVTVDCPAVQGTGYCRETGAGPECYDSCESVPCNTPQAPYCKDSATLATPYGPGTCYFIESCNYPETLTPCPNYCSSNQCF